MSTPFLGTCRRFLNSHYFILCLSFALNSHQIILNANKHQHLTTEVNGGYLGKGFDIRTTIVMTKAHIDLPKTHEAIAAGCLDHVEAEHF